MGFVTGRADNFLVPTRWRLRDLSSRPLISCSGQLSRGPLLKTYVHVLRFANSRHHQDYHHRADAPRSSIVRCIGSLMPPAAIQAPLTHCRITSTFNCSLSPFVFILSFPLNRWSIYGDLESLQSPTEISETLDIVF